MAINTQPWQGIHTGDVDANNPERGKLIRFPDPNEIPDLNFNTSCAFHTIMEMINIVHDRLQKMDEKLDRLLPE